jgi:hypothetical protein
MGVGSREWGVREKRGRGKRGEGGKEGKGR